MGSKNEENECSYYWLYSLLDSSLHISASLSIKRREYEKRSLSKTREEFYRRPRPTDASFSFAKTINQHS